MHINFDCVTGAQRYSKSSYRSVRCANERGSEVTGKLVEGAEGIVPLSKLNGTETASDAMRCELESLDW